MKHFENLVHATVHAKQRERTKIFTFDFLPELSVRLLLH